MALQSSGAISLSNVAVELGRASNATTSLGESAAREVADGAGRKGLIVLTYTPTAGSANPGAMFAVF